MLIFMNTIVKIGGYMTYRIEDVPVLLLMTQIVIPTSMFE